MLKVNNRLKATYAPAEPSSWLIFFCEHVIRNFPLKDYLDGCLTIEYDKPTDSVEFHVMLMSRDKTSKISGSYIVPAISIQGNDKDTLSKNVIDVIWNMLKNP